MQLLLELYDAQLEIGDAHGEVHNKGKSPEMRVFFFNRCLPAMNSFFSIQKAEKMFYAAGCRRYQFARGRACARSIPLSSIASSSGRIDTLCASRAFGQWKRPRSSRLAHTHRPLPSNISAFSRLCVRFVNKNKCPLKGS